MEKQEIRNIFPKTIFPSVFTAPIWYGHRAHTKYQDRVAVIGKYGEEEIPYGIASEEYKLVSHEETVDRMLVMLEGLKEFGEPILDLRMIAQGAKMELRVQFPEIRHEVRPGDPMNPELRVRNSYDLTWEFEVSMWARQLVCSNGMVATKSLLNKKQKHRLNLDTHVIIGEMITGLEQFSEQVGLWQQFAQKTLNQLQFNEIWDALPFGERHREKIRELPLAFNRNENLNKWAAKGEVNMWDLHSVVTQFLSNEVESDLVQIAKTEAIEPIFEKFYKFAA